MLLLIVVVGMPVLVNAQKITDEIAYMHTISRASKRHILKDYLKIEDHEAAAFWKLYDEYEAERKILEQEQMLLTKNFIDNYSAMTDKEANEIAKRMFVYNLYSERINKKYYSKFRKAISPLKAAQFLQLESYIQNNLQIYLQDRFFINQMEGVESAHKDDTNDGSGL